MIRERDVEATGTERNRWRSSEYVLWTIGAPCIAFALLRLLLIIIDQGLVFQTAYLPFFAGTLSRGLGPIVMLALLSARPLNLDLYRKTLIPAVLLTSVFAAALIVAPVPANSGWTVLFRVLSHLGFGWLYVCWANAFAHTRVYDVAISMTLSMIVTSVLAWVCAYVPSFVSAALVASIPVFTTWLFIVYTRNGHPREPYRTEFMGPGVTGEAFGEYARWFVVLGMYSVSIGMVHALSISSPNAGGGGWHFDLYSALSIVFSAGLLASIFLRRGIFSLPVMWAVFAALATALLGFSLVAPDVSQAAFAAFAALRYTVLAFLNIKLIDIAHHSKYPPYVVFAIGWAVVFVFLVLGGSLVMNAAAMGGLATSAPVVVLIALLLTGTLFVFGGSSLSDVRIGPAPMEEAPTEAESIADIQYRQCQQLRDRYNLTDRETEVVLLIAQGHTQAYCADALMVSHNTVRAHMKHVYVKLDIHSKDELLEKLEEASG